MTKPTAGPTTNLGTELEEPPIADPESGPEMLRASATLCANLLKGMHAAAQPLTILRGVLSRGSGEGSGLETSLDEYRALAESSASEVERLCTLFSYMQQLVLAESTKPHLSAMHVLPLLTFVEDGVNLIFKEAGMSLKMQVEDTCQSIFIDSSRTHQAVSGALLVAHAVSTANDTIELIASSHAGGIRIVVSNAAAFHSMLNAEASLGLALAEANLRSQQGSLSYGLKPFRVVMELPGAPLIQ